MFSHVPVLLNEVLSYLDPRPGGRFIDATLGTAGHTQALLERTAPDGAVLGLDQDETTLEQTRRTLQSFGSRVALSHANFREIRSIAEQAGFLECDGVLADIGISSMMVDDPERG